MWAILDRIRNQPKAVRNQYAAGAATIITGVIAVVWAVSIPGQLASLNAPEVNSEAAAIGAFSQFLTRARENISGMAAAVMTVGATTSVEQLVAPTSESTATSTTPAFVLPDLSRLVAATSAATVTPSIVPRRALIATTTSQRHTASTTRSQ